MMLGNAVGIFLIVSGIVLLAMGFLPAMLSGQVLTYPDIPASIKLGLVLLVTGTIINIMAIGMNRIYKQLMKDNKKKAPEK